MRSSCFLCPVTCKMVVDVSYSFCLRMPSIFYASGYTSVTGLSPSPPLVYAGVQQGSNRQSPLPGPPTFLLLCMLLLLSREELSSLFPLANSKVEHLAYSPSSAFSTLVHTRRTRKKIVAETRPHDLPPQKNYFTFRSPRTTNNRVLS